MTLTRMHSSGTATGRQTMECITWPRAIRHQESLVEVIYKIVHIGHVLCVILVLAVALRQRSLEVHKEHHNCSPTALNSLLATLEKRCIQKHLSSIRRYA